MNPFKYIKIEKIKKFSQLMRGLLLWFFSLIFCVVSLIVYSTGTLNLTHFLIKGVEQDENGYYLVEDGQEVEILIKSDFTHCLYILHFSINGVDFFPQSKEDDENLVAISRGYERDEEIIVKYKIKKGEEVLILENVKICGITFPVLGNKFNYNGKGKIYLKIKDN